MIIVDGLGLVDKHKEQVFPEDEFTESMISLRVQGSAHMACTRRSLRLDGTT